MTAGVRLATYSMHPVSLEAAAVMFGVVEPRGRLPVTIPGLAERGHGLA